MARNTMFGRGRDWRPEDDNYGAFHLGSRGPRVGDYDPYSSAEYSDTYYGPHDDYAQRGSGSGYNRDEEDPVPPQEGYVGGVTGQPPRAHWSSNRLYGEVRSYGEMHPGDRSWADLGVHSVDGGESGITERSADSHRGRGPKGYRRSDERLREIVCEHLTEDPRIDASEIDVKVENGEILLSGSVPSRRDKRVVEHIVEQCTGDAPIHNNLSHQDGWKPETAS